MMVFLYSDALDECETNVRSVLFICNLTDPVPYIKDQS